MVVRDAFETMYPLGVSDAPSVRIGDAVAAGDVIARRSQHVAIAAYAATLRLPVEVAAEEMARHHGTPVEAGASLGTRRVGLVMRGIAAPTTGIVQSLPRSGAVVVHADTNYSDYRARFGGIVRAIQTDAITITTAVARWTYAFADDEVQQTGPVQITDELLSAALDASTMPRTLPPAMSHVVAHLSDLGVLRTQARSASGTLIVGTVTESVAWSLLSRPGDRNSRNQHKNRVVVLSGVGSLAQGVQAVASFRGFHGAQTVLNRFAHTVSVILPDGPFPATASEADDADWTAAIRRDPVHYNEPCEIQGAPFVAILDAHARVLCTRIRGDATGERLAPSSNVQCVLA
ncbi:MAG: hypothetical protein ACYDAR_04490 [Thermomicrobiales bacterium]